jgi:hypothetical protein
MIWGRLVAGVICALTMWGAACANASVEYSYTGNDFTTVISDIGGPYTTSDSVTGSFVLPTALAGNLPGAVVNPTSFSFFDGIQTLSTGNSTSVFFRVWTDGSGHIENWEVRLENNGLGYNYLVETYNDPPGLSPTVQDLGSQRQIFIPVNRLIQGSNLGLPGTWEVTNVPAVPEPSTWATMLIGFAGLGFAGYRKAKRAQGLVPPA